MAAGRLPSRRRRPSTRRSLVAAARKAFREDGGDGALSGRDRSLAENQGGGEGQGRAGLSYGTRSSSAGWQTQANVGDGGPGAGPGVLCHAVLSAACPPDLLLQRLDVLHQLLAAGLEQQVAVGEPGRVAQANKLKQLGQLRKCGWGGWSQGAADQRPRQVRSGTYATRVRPGLQGMSRMNRPAA